MASIITIAGEKLFAAKAQANEQLDIDTFIFANVPGQDPAAPVNREEGIPTEHIVHQQIVQQNGRINENVVVYSTVLDSITGPFEFNWVGLYSAINDTLVAINHVPTTPKTATAEGVAGNTLNRNFGIEYSGIADLTGITVAPETWQLDFTARLQGMDKLTQQLAADMNGKDWFIDDGFKVEPRETVNTFKILPGVGYVSGLRVELENEHIFTVESYPKFVYVDAWFEGDASSTWSPSLMFTVSDTEIDDYTDAAGVKHYVNKLAEVTAFDTVLDLRTDSESANKIWVEKVNAYQADMLNGNGGILVGTLSSLIGKEVLDHTGLQVNKWPNDKKNTLFTLIPQQNGIIESLDLEQGVLFLKNNNKPLILSEKSSDKGVDVSQFKLDLTGTNDETEKLKAIAEFSNGKDVFGFSGKIRISAPLVFEKPNSIDFGEVEFVLNKDQHQFVKPVVTIGEAGQTEVGVTAFDLAEGVQNIGSYEGLKVGDVISIWSPVDGSWSGYRAAYRKGEYHQVTDINPNVIIDGPLFDNYEAGTKIIKLPARKIKVSGKVNITNEGAYGSLLGVKLENVIGGDFSGLDVELLGGTHALSVNRGYNCDGKGMRAFQKSDKTSGLDYGLVIAASQNCRFYGDFHAERHGATYGSSGSVGDAINRDCFVGGSVTTTGQGGVQAANMHGNAERCGFGGFLQGYNPSGHDSYLAPGTKVVSPRVNLVPVQFGEMKSTKHSLRGAEVVMYGTTTTRGMIDAGGNSVSFGEYCVIGGVLDFSNVKAKGDAHKKSALTLKNRGAVVEWSINADGFVAETPLAISGIAISPASGLAPKSISMNASDLWKVGNGLSIASETAVYGVAQSGKGTIWVAEGEGPATTSPITFDNSFHKKPIITITHNKGIIGSSIPIVKDVANQTSGFTLAVINANGQPWSVGQFIEYIWKAEV
mgnify:CR=1 FL=1